MLQYMISQMDPGKPESYAIITLFSLLLIVIINTFYTGFITVSFVLSIGNVRLSIRLTNHYCSFIWSSEWFYVEISYLSLTNQYKYCS